MTKQDDLRHWVKIAKVQNPDWTYKNISEAINITTNAFYNFMSGYYNLSDKKAHELKSLLYDLTI